MKQEKSRARDRILDRLVRKLGSSPIRKDITVVSYNLLDEHSARVTAAYAGKIPTYEDLRSWAIAVVQGSIRILPDTVMVHNTLPYPLLSFAVESNIVRKPLDQALNNGNFIKVKANRYLDTDLGDTWGVEELNGKKFLVRVGSDGLKEMLEGKIKHMGAKTWKNANKVLAMVAYKDDSVRFILPDMTVSNGTVIRVKEDGILTIKDAKSKSVFERPYAAVLEVTKRGGDAREAKRKVYDYMEELYGPDLAKEITTGL